MNCATPFPKLRELWQAASRPQKFSSCSCRSPHGHAPGAQPMKEHFDSGSPDRSAAVTRLISPSRWGPTRPLKSVRFRARAAYCSLQAAHRGSENSLWWDAYGVFPAARRNSSGSFGASSTIPRATTSGDVNAFSPFSSLTTWASESTKSWPRILRRG